MTIMYDTFHTLLIDSLFVLLCCYCPPRASVNVSRTRMFLQSYTTVSYTSLPPLKTVRLFDMNSCDRVVFICYINVKCKCHWTFVAIIIIIIITFMLIC